MTIETPHAPNGMATVWIGDWECSYNADAEYWTGEGYIAYKGGCDLDAPKLSAWTWASLLKEIGDHDDD